MRKPSSLQDIGTLLCLLFSSSKGRTSQPRNWLKTGEVQATDLYARDYYVHDGERVNDASSSTGEIPLDIYPVKLPSEDRCMSTCDADDRCECAVFSKAYLECQRFAGCRANPSGFVDDPEFSTFLKLPKVRPTYKVMQSYNTYSSSGSREIDRAGVPSIVSTVEECQDRCTVDLTCDCVVFANDGTFRCWKREGCQSQTLVFDSVFDTFLKERPVSTSIAITWLSPKTPEVPLQKTIDDIYGWVPEQTFTETAFPTATFTSTLTTTSISSLTTSETSTVTNCVEVSSGWIFGFNRRVNCYVGTPPVTTTASTTNSGTSSSTATDTATITTITKLFDTSMTFPSTLTTTSVTQTNTVSNTFTRTDSTTTWTNFIQVLPTTFGQSPDTSTFLTSTSVTVTSTTVSTSSTSTITASTSSVTSTTTTSTSTSPREMILAAVEELPVTMDLLLPSLPGSPQDLQAQLRTATGQAALAEALADGLSMPAGNVRPQNIIVTADSSEELHLAATFNLEVPRSQALSLLPKIYDLKQPDSHSSSNFLSAFPDRMQEAARSDGQTLNLLAAVAVTDSSNVRLSAAQVQMSPAVRTYLSEVQGPLQGRSFFAPVGDFVSSTAFRLLLLFATILTLAVILALWLSGVGFMRRRGYHQLMGSSNDASRSFTTPFETRPSRVKRVKDLVERYARRASDLLLDPEPDYQDTELVYLVRTLNQCRAHAKALCGSPWGPWQTAGDCQVCRRRIDRSEKGLQCGSGGHRLCWPCMCRIMNWESLARQEGDSAWTWSSKDWI